MRGEENLSNRDDRKGKEDREAMDYSQVVWAVDGRLEEGELAAQNKTRFQRITRGWRNATYSLEENAGLVPWTHMAPHSCL